MDALTTFGLVAVTAMLVTYALEERSPHYILAFAFAGSLGSIYGFLQGAWPFGLIEPCGPGSPCGAGRERRANARADFETASCVFASGGLRLSPCSGRGSMRCKGELGGDITLLLGQAAKTIGVGLDLIDVEIGFGV